MKTFENMGFRSFMVLIGLVLLGIFGIFVTLKYEQQQTDNNGEKKIITISPYIAIPIVLVGFYFYISNFSILTYLISLGVVFIFFV